MLYNSNIMVFKVYDLHEKYEKNSRKIESYILILEK